VSGKPARLIPLVAEIPAGEALNIRYLEAQTALKPTGK
jgi:hypothetical protein